MIKENKKDERLKTAQTMVILITDGIIKYCIFGTIVSLLNVKPNWEKVIYLSFNSFIHPFLACYLC
jgi:transcriptional regulator of NAD metabolism